MTIKEPQFAERRAKEVLDIVKAKSYRSSDGSIIDISEPLKVSVKETEFWDSYRLIKDFLDTVEDVRMYNTPTITVTNETTTLAIKRLYDANVRDIAALNFASSKNPGGGFIRGAQAQEEDLCRSSNLYHCLRDQEIFYQYYQLAGALGTDNLIYSPDVVFFKDENYQNLKSPVYADIITAAAPNIQNSPELRTSEPVKNILYNRIYLIIASAVLHGSRNLVLGAWGAGVFGNSPEVVAEAFKQAIGHPHFNNCFDSIVFAVWDNTPLQHNLKAFQHVFA